MPGEGDTTQCRESGSFNTLAVTPEASTICSCRHCSMHNGYDPADHRNLECPPIIDSGKNLRLVGLGLDVFENQRHGNGGAIPNIQRDTDDLTEYLRSYTSDVEVSEIQRHVSASGSCWTSRPTGFVDHLDPESPISISAAADSGSYLGSVSSSATGSTNAYSPLEDHDWAHTGAWCDEDADDGREISEGASISDTNAGDGRLASGIESHRPSADIQGESSDSKDKSIRLFETSSDHGSKAIDTTSESSQPSCNNNASTEGSGAEYDYSSDGGTSESEELGPSLMSSNISQLAHNIVDTFMNDIRFLFDAKSGIIQCTNGHNDGRSNAKRQNDQNNSNSNAGQFNGGMKRRNSRDGGQGSPYDDDEDEDEDEDDNDDKRRKLHNGERKFACPYFKRDPKKHKHRKSCAGPGLKNISRLKEHLYLYHEAQPCPRCHVDFGKAEAVTVHLNALERCESCKTCDTVPHSYEGFDTKMRSQLKSRRGWSKKSAIEKWKAIYQILFPGDDLDNMPSPFYDDDSEAERNPSSKFQQYCRRELPRRVRMRLEKVVEKTLQQIGFSGGIEPIIQNCFDEVVSDFEKESSAKDTRQRLSLINTERIAINPTDNTTSATGIRSDLFEDPPEESPIDHSAIAFNGFNPNDLKPYIDFLSGPYPWAQAHMGSGASSSEPLPIEQHTGGYGRWEGDVGDVDDERHGSPIGYGGNTSYGDGIHYGDSTSYWGSSGS